MAQCLFAPGQGHGVDVQIGLAGGEQAVGAQFGQACIQLATDAAEIGIAGIAQPQYRVLQFRQLGCALAGDEFHQANRIVRGIAFTLGTDDHVEQALAGQFALRVGIGAQQAHVEAGGLGFVGSGFGHTSCVAGLAAVDNGQALAGLCRAAGQHGQMWSRMTLGQAGGITGQPP